MKTKLMSCLFCVGVGLVPSMASSMNEEVQEEKGIVLPDIIIGDIRYDVLGKVIICI